MCRAIVDGFESLVFLGLPVILSKKAVSSRREMLELSLPLAFELLNSVLPPMSFDKIGLERIVHLKSRVMAASL